MMASANEVGRTTPGAVGSALTVERRDDGVFVVRMDVPGEPVNTLRASFAEEFSRLFDEIERDAACKAVVFTSGKKTGFIAGADITMLQNVRSEREAADLSRAGQRALDRIATCRAPVVAAIHGAALGGGLEVAMACHARVASDDPKTRLGLPEVQLGLLPGAGGTQRLPRLLPIRTALDLLLTGKQIDAKKAQKIGLVDEVVPEPILLDVACRRALAMVANHARPASAAPSPRRHGALESVQEAALTRTPIGRRIVFDQARKQLLAKTRGNYPAPERILEVVERGLERGFEAGLEAEAQAFGELVVSPQAAQLMHLFFATNALKKDAGTGDVGVQARPVTRLGMVGAGLMGAGIAYVTASVAGIPVRLKDKDAEGLARGLTQIKSLLDGRVARKRLTARQASEQLALVTATTGYEGFRGCEVVIEAVFEDLALKHRVLKEVEAIAPEAIFASNTSSIPIAKIAEASARPEKVIGMHYFSPVDKMPLLEVVVTPKTAPWVTASCVELGKKQGKTVIVVHDGVGFYTSRILAPLLNEAAFVLSEGVRVEDIDEALIDWGFPVGPITLLDEVGIDVAEKVGHIVHAAFGDRMRPPPGFDKLIADRRFGRKNGRGFYLYGDEKKSGKKKVDESVYAVLGLSPGKPVPRDEIAQRCALAFVNEACLCYGEGILRSARDGDVGAIFGLGFPPFRGGPFRWVDTVGAREVVRRLERLRDRHGARFAPAPVLVEMAKSGATFHGERAIPPGRHRESAASRPAGATV